MGESERQVCVRVRTLQTTLIAPLTEIEHSTSSAWLFTYRYTDIGMISSLPVIRLKGLSAQQSFFFIIMGRIVKVYFLIVHYCGVNGMGETSQ